MEVYFVLWISLCIDGIPAFLGADKEKITTEGMTTTVVCLYDVTRYTFSTKYWCQGSSRLSCTVLGNTETFVHWNYKSRLSLTDNRRGVLLVTMQQLVEDDSGTYWCGIDQPYADIMIAVKLKVNKGPEIHTYIRVAPSPAPSSMPSSTVGVTTSFPDSTFHLHVSHLFNSTGYHNITERKWNYSPWDICRWVILVILVASFIVIHWGTM